MKRITFSLILILCLLFAGNALAGSSDNYRIDWITPLTGNGGGSASSANYAVSFTVGQTVVGASAGGSYTSCTGFWCAVLRTLEIYLPLISNK